MTYYKDENNELYAFDDSATSDDVQNLESKLGITLTSITEKEYKTLTAPTLDELKTLKSIEIKQSFDEELSRGYSCLNGIKMDARLDDIIKFKSGVDLAEQVGSTTIDIRDFDNQVHTVNIDDAKTMLIELGTNYQQQLAKKWNLDQSIKQVSSKDDLDAIVW